MTSPNAPEPEVYTPAMYDSPKPVSQQNETSAAVLGARARAEIEARTLVALNRPRNLNVFRDQILKSCERIRFADSAMYEKPVGGGKTATGLTIRFAEECARFYGNLDNSVSVVHEDDERRIIEAMSVDLERNTVHRSQSVVPKYVERLKPNKGDEVISQRTNSRGLPTYKIRASDDAMFTVHQAHAAKALREVVLRHIPSDIKDECEEKIGQTMQDIGNKDPEKFKKEMLQSFYMIGVSEAQVAEWLGKPVSQINVAEIHFLRRVCQGIKQGEGSWAEVMDARRSERAAQAQAEGKAEPSAAPKGGGEMLASRVAGAPAAGSRRRSDPAPADPKPAAAEGTPSPVANLTGATEAERIDVLRARKANGIQLSDDDLEELRQYDEDHPHG